ncbi:MAG: DUF2156 domain-containing protein [Desulfocapsaceae bacterium]|nr:DUF2156 domain-containing protein [Desulfocapsaceae bacterium]
MIPVYPASAEITLALRPLLHPRFQMLADGISEFTFANMFLFRQAHGYKISMLAEDLPVIHGKDAGASFFMLPFGLPDAAVLNRLFCDHGQMKCVSAEQKSVFENLGYRVVEDRDNFDYLYLRKDLAELSGRKFHKKRNLVKAFAESHNYEGRPLLEEYLGDALQILEDWRQAHDTPGDYAAAREALEKSWDLQLCGGIYYVENRPVAYTLGEELAKGTSFVIHFEKAVSGYKGLFQFINQAFASILPDMYVTINREQDLGDDGLRRAKHSYKPSGYVEKYRVFPQI